MPKKNTSTTAVKAKSTAKKPASAKKPVSAKTTPSGQSQKELTTPPKKSPSATVKRALKQASATEKQPGYEPVTVKLTVSQLDKLKELSSTLAVADRFILNLAIRYAVTYSLKKKQSLENMEGFPKRFGNIPQEIEMTADTVMQLSEHDFMDKAKELAVIGLKLLHERLLKF
jgi:hypothetical protein